MAHGNKTAAGILGVGCAAYLCWLGFIVFLIWAAIHFIGKFW